MKARHPTDMRKALLTALALASGTAVAQQQYEVANWSDATTQWNNNDNNSVTTSYQYPQSSEIDSELGGYVSTKIVKPDDDFFDIVDVSYTGQSVSACSSSSTWSKSQQNIQFDGAPVSFGGLPILPSRVLVTPNVSTGPAGYETTFVGTYTETDTYSDSSGNNSTVSYQVLNAPDITTLQGCRGNDGYCYSNSGTATSGSDPQITTTVSQGNDDTFSSEITYQVTYVIGIDTAATNVWTLTPVTMWPGNPTSGGGDVTSVLGLGSSQGPPPK